MLDSLKHYKADIGKDTVSVSEYKFLNLTTRRSYIQLGITFNPLQNQVLIQSTIFKNEEGIWNHYNRSLTDDYVITEYKGLWYIILSRSSKLSEVSELLELTHQYTKDYILGMSWLTEEEITKITETKEFKFRSEFDDLREHYMEEYEELHGQDNDDYKTEDTRWDMARESAKSDTMEKYRLTEEEFEEYDIPWYP